MVKAIDKLPDKKNLTGRVVKHIIKPEQRLKLQKWLFLKNKHIKSFEGSGVFEW